MESCSQWFATQLASVDLLKVCQKVSIKTENKVETLIVLNFASSNFACVLQLVFFVS